MDRHTVSVRLRSAWPAITLTLLTTLVAVAVTVAAARTSGASAPAAPTRPASTQTVHAAAAPAPEPGVAPLRHRTRADILIVAGHPLSAHLIRRISRLTHAPTVNVAASARVHLGAGRSLALGVDPSTFRAFTPAGTAEVDALWRSVAAGDAAVAHVVGTALRIPLGGAVTIGRGTPVPVRVGAFATTALPGVGVVVAASRSGALGLTPRSALVVSVPRAADAPSIARQLRAIPQLASADVSTVQRFVTLARQAAWVAPAAGVVSSPFGVRVFPLDPRRRDFHPGIDIAAPYGAPVWAAAAGTVLYAGPAAGFGNEIILLHPDGVTTVYGHMSRLLVTAGSVRPGQPIALVGSEGESTGPHLHFEVHVHDRLVDPLAWLRTHGVPIRS